MADQDPRRRSSRLAALPPVSYEQQLSPIRSARRPYKKPPNSKKSTSESDVNKIAPTAAAPFVPVSPSLRPTTTWFAAEIWLNIQSNFLLPRLLTIKVSPNKKLQVTGDIERIPSALYMTKVALTEALKTHNIIFDGILSKPALFRAETDVFHFSNATSLSHLISAPNCLALARPLKVRFAALTLDRSNTFGLDGGTCTIGDSLAKVARIFGTIEKVVLVINVSTDSTGVDSAAEKMKLRIEDTLRDRYEKAKTVWQDWEQKGFPMANKWEPLQLLLVFDESVVLTALEERLAVDNGAEKGAEDVDA